MIIIVVYTIDVDIDNLNLVITGVCIMELAITINRIFVLKSTNKPLKAFADIIVNGALVIKGIKVVSGKNGMFVSMPQEQNTQNKKWYPTVRCLDTDVRDKMQKTVLDAYSKASQN